MNFIKKYQQFIKFGLVALSYNLFAYAIYVGLVALKYNYLLTSSFSFIAGVTLSYFMNKSIVFATKQQNYRLILRYLLFYLALLGFNLGVLHVFVESFTINPYFSQILVIFISALVSYNTMRVFVFRHDMISNKYVFYLLGKKGYLVLSSITDVTHYELNFQIQRAAV
jgi:putative flippase GtrA